MSDPLSKQATATRNRPRRDERQGQGGGRGRSGADAHRDQRAQGQRLHRCCRRAGEEARRRDRFRPASRTAGRACPSRSRTCSTSRACRRAPARRSTSMGRRRRATARWCASSRRPARSWSAASTWASTPTTSPARTPITDPSRNPHDPTRMTGGSSGGSGAAVASGEVPLALGSDTNGSIRVPSSLCGLFGLKPTYGRLSRAGSFPFVDAFDHLGPLARSVEDLALSFDAMQGWDPDDPVCTDRPPSRPCRNCARASVGCASPSPATISPRAPSPKRWRRSRRWPRRWVRPKPSSFRRPRRRARRPMSSPPSRAASSICRASGRGRRISIPTRASASWRARCCPAPGTSRRSASAGTIAPRCRSCSARSTSSWRRPRPAPRPSSARS